MSAGEQFSITDQSLIQENIDLRLRLAETEAKLAEAQELIQAIQSGDVDAVVVSGPQGEQVYTLQGAEYAYRALVEAMNEGAATLAPDGAVMYCNRRLSQILGIPLENIIGSHIGSLLSAESAHVVEALLVQARSGEAISIGLDLHTTSLQTAGATTVPVQISIREMQSVEPMAFCMVVTDLTESKARDELVAAGKLASLILESAAEAIAVCDEAGSIINCNDAFESLCGFNPLFRSFDSILPLQVAEGASEGVQHFSITNALSGYRFTGLELLLPRKSGQIVSLLLSASPLRGENSIAGCVVTLTDITSRKQAQKALLQSEKLASVGRMASTIAHEINNPLEAIGQLLYLAVINPQISPEINSYLDLAVKELERISHITQQALAFHHDTGVPAPLNLRPIVDSVLNLFGGRIRTKEITVKTRFRGDPTIHALSSEIRQVVANLFSNSMDALPNNGLIELRVLRTTARDGSPTVRFTIADSGAGISPDGLQRIFEPFYSTKQNVGVGLGLWVSRQIVEKHGATFRVKSKPGAGTIFTITFPAAPSTLSS